MQRLFFKTLLLILILAPSSFASNNQCSEGMCAGVISESHVSVLAKEIVANLTNIKAANFEVNCSKKEDKTWRCFLKQIPEEGEVLPPGRFWNIGLNLESGEYEVFGAF